MYVLSYHFQDQLINRNDTPQIREFHEKLRRLASLQFFPPILIPTPVSHIIYFNRYQIKRNIDEIILQTFMTLLP